MTKPTRSDKPAHPGDQPDHPQAPPAGGAGDSEPDGMGMHEASRRKNLQAIAALGVDPWGGRFDGREWIGDLRARAGEVKYRLETGVEIPLPDLRAEGFDFRAWKSEQGAGTVIGPPVRAAGRILFQRPTGKLIFINIRDWTGDIQLLVGKNQVGDRDFELAKLFDLGDIIGVDGQLAYTNTGELTIFAEHLHFLCKSIAPPPEKYHGLTDPELRQRRRYLDLMYTDGVLARFLQRTQIVQSIRATLSARQFVEVEGPTLHSIAGGAAARPFVTHHNALDIDLFMRIALELHLKRLMVGGMERVYELGRVYRNEGISPRHNPEFTMLEVYQALGNYETMMELTEQMIVAAIDAIGGGYRRRWGDATIDFTPPFARRTYDELIAEHVGVAADDAPGLARVADQLGLHTEGKHPDVVKNFVFEEKVESQLTGPVFVTDYPASICPLTKRSRTSPHLAERFELFIEGMEVANAYTELNDPDLQEELFRTQLAGLPEDDSMARMDMDFVRALRHGMPPAGGLGIGIDRLVMLLTDAQSIREVILFPLLRPTE